jgi:serine/threonine protein kinase
MRTRRYAKPPLTVADLLAALRAARLLSRRRLARLQTAWASLSDANNVRDRLPELIAAGHLTAYQADQVLAGHAHRLLLGPYRILDRLGDGGQGKVYKAEHRFMKRVVALKVLARLRPQDRPRRCRATPPSSIVIDLRPGLPSREEALRRFRGEVEALARLSHPNVVAAYDAAEARGTLYLVMEFIEGTDLGRLIMANGPLPPEEACAYVRQTALALQHLHEQGIVHGDVKPTNLMLSRKNGPAQVKLLDLGLARIKGRLRKPASSNGSTPKSPLAGTPDFMAPELAHDPDAADVRSDLYSLGCTFFYLLTGDVPFPGESWTEKLLRHHFDRPPSVRDLQPEVPAAVTGIIRRLLAKEPNDRFQTPLELIRALDEGGGEQKELLRIEDRGSRIEERKKDSKSTGGKRGNWLVSYLLPRLKWAATGMAAVLVGWLIAVAVRSSGTDASNDAGASIPNSRATEQTARTPVYFSIEKRDDKFPTLAEAVASASDEAILLVHGNGPIPTLPVAWQGKALTIRAVPGCKPVLQLATMNKDVPPWTALLSSDRRLTLVGLTLRGDEEGRAGRLLYVEKADLSLTDCRLETGPGSAAVVCRNGSEVHLQKCTVEAGSAAVSAEIGEVERCRIILAHSTIHLAQSGGAALAVWAPERRRPTSTEFLLEGNVIRGGRVAAFTALPAPVAVAARDNDFSFREALVAFADCGGPKGWKRLLHWQGRNNHYRPAGSWLQVDGEPGPIRGLAAWSELWPGEETGSREMAANSPNSLTLGKGNRFPKSR